MVVKPQHPDWSGRTVAVVCNGPSLTPEQCDAVRAAGLPAIAVNTGYLLAPWATVLYAGDMLFWRVHAARMRKAAPEAQLWTADASSAERYHLRFWKGVNRPGLGRTHVSYNGNSGAQALNLAFLFGATKILLLGMTMRTLDGRKHFHGDHEAPLTQNQLFDEWLKKLDVFARDARDAGLEVINCDTLSAAHCFRPGDLTEELALENR